MSIRIIIFTEDNLLLRIKLLFIISISLILLDHILSETPFSNCWLSFLTRIVAGFIFEKNLAKVLFLLRVLIEIRLL